MKLKLQLARFWCLLLKLEGFRKMCQVGVISECLKIVHIKGTRNKEY